MYKNLGLFFQQSFAEFIAKSLCLPVVPDSVRTVSHRCDGKNLSRLLGLFKLGKSLWSKVEYRGIYAAFQTEGN